MCQLPFPLPSSAKSPPSPPTTLPQSPISPRPFFPSYNLGQECFNFRDRFCLSSQAEWPVVQRMRCDGCKTIKKKKEQEMGENKEEKSSLYWTDLITLNRD